MTKTTTTTTMLATVKLSKLLYIRGRKIKITQKPVRTGESVELFKRSKVSLSSSSEFKDEAGEVWGGGGVMDMRRSESAEEAEAKASQCQGRCR